MSVSLHVCVSVIGSVRTLSLAGADFTGVSPALTWHSSTAARVLGCVLRFWSLAAPIFKLGIAVVHAYILWLKHSEKSGGKLETLPLCLKEISVFVIVIILGD